MNPAEASPWQKLALAAPYRDSRPSTNRVESRAKSATPRLEPATRILVFGSTTHPGVVRFLP
ncbi:hypothetical protein [Streptomyces sp. NPDC048338]|uniref:hypothetical protein n=1 Tax=Streptomyces sp. NPDC048338 TaxID=3365536 RepID=UPI003717CF05